TDTAPPTAIDKPEAPEKPAPLPVGVYQIAVTGLGTADLNSSVAPVQPATGGPSASLGVAGTGIVFEQVSSSSFTEGARGAGGQRYVTFTYRVRNGTGTPLTNLTMMLVSRTGTVAGTALSLLRRFDGSAADPAIATRVVPTGAVTMDSDLTTMLATYPDVLQVLTEAEVASIAPPADVTNILPVGYVVRNKNATTTRLLPAAADPNQYDGVLTLSFRLPLQAAAAQDVFSFFFQVLAVTDTETRLTESMEEAADTAAVRRLRDRALALGATTVTVLNGSPAVSPAVADYPGQRQVCGARTAGTAAAPVTSIVTPSAYTRLAVYRPGQALNGCSPFFAAGEPLFANYGLPYAVTLRAMDRYGNQIASADTVRLASTDPGAVMPAPVALAGGAAAPAATYTTYGSSTLRATGRRLAATSPVTVWGMTRTWTGNVDTGWLTNGDWLQNVAPGVQDSVVIPGGRPYYPVLVQNTTIGGITMTDGATAPRIDLSLYDLTVTGSVNFGTTGSMPGTGRLVLTGENATVGGGVSNADVRNLRVTGTYSTTSNISVTGGRLFVQGGRLRSQGNRVRVQPQ
ncbi:MAG TPA: hypothetical protein VF665_24030, partial [Longimicrobium sp.]